MTPQIVRRTFSAWQMGAGGGLSGDLLLFTEVAFSRSPKTAERAPIREPASSVPGKNLPRELDCGATLHAVTAFCEGRKWWQWSLR